MFGARFWVDVAGSATAALLALWVLNQGDGERASPSPPPVGQRVEPAPQSPPRRDETPVPAPTPNRNEIRLPLRPVKKETGPLQVKREPALADPNSADANGVTPFMGAARAGDTARLEALYREGADLNQADNRAHSALYYAIEGRSGPAVQWLIEHGASTDCNCCDGTGAPLLHAYDTGEFTIIEPVLRAERRWHWCDRSLEELFRALRMRDKRYICALLAGHRAPPTLEDSRQPLLGYAIAWQDDDLLALLLECGADPNAPLESPVDRDFSRYIADATLRYYLESEPGLTPLMLAAGMGRVDYVQLLMQYGAKRGLATRGKYRMTAMDIAARRSARPQMLQVLLGKSPRPEDQRMSIHVSIGRQQAVFYKDGRVALVTPVSTGKPGFPTPVGEFVVTDKDRLRRSTLYPAYMPYFMRMSCRDFGMHAGDLPGYPASHGCIRLPAGNAERLFREVDIGTLVTISR